MDRLVGMAVFAKVVEGSSFASAARHFGLSPAMVSKHIQALEERLGARLLYRTTRRVSATEVGQDYYVRTLRILAELAEADRAAGDLQTAPRGRLKVSASVAFGTRYVASAISDYMEAYPNVSIELWLDDRHVDLLEEGVDLAIRTGPEADSSLIARRLLSAHMVLCASPGYLAQHGTPAAPDDLAQHNCLIQRDGATQSEWHFISSDGGAETVQVSGRLQANNSDVLKALALAGGGILLQPGFIVSDDVRAGRLIALLPAYRPADMPIHAVYPHSRHMPAKVRTFVDFLAARFGRELEHSRSSALEGRSAVPKLRVVG